MALSINLIDHSHPVIWQVSALPYDCQFCAAVPKPLGGLLVMAANSVIYLDQSVPPYGTSVNHLTNGSTQFALRRQKNTEPISFVNAKTCFIKDNTLCISLENGDVYFLVLKRDSMNNVRAFHLRKSASAVTPTTLTPLSDDLIFLGSRLGNSLLLKYTVRDEVEEEVPAKRKRANTTSEIDTQKPKTADKSVLEYEEEELTSIEGYYGDEIDEIDLNEVYELKTLDSMNNIGPCANAELIHSSYTNDQLDEDSRDRNMDLMVLTGRGKSGGISLLQKSVRPAVVTPFPFPTQYNDMWTLSKSEDLTSLLVITKKDQTKVFKTGSSIEELKREECGLSTTARTVYCGTLNNGDYIVQVLPRAVILVNHENQEKLQHLPIDLDGVIAEAASCDPFLVIVTSKGSILTLSLVHDIDGKPLMQASKTPEQFPDNPEKRITHVTMFKDNQAYFKLTKGMKSQEETVKQTSNRQMSVISEFRGDTTNNILTAEEEDELLYGTELNEQPLVAESTNENVDWVDAEPTGRVWLIITRQCGYIEFYTLPDCELRFKDRNFSNAPRLIEQSRFEGSFGDRRQDVPVIQEVNLFPLGPRGIPHLVALIADQLIIYKYRPYKIKYEAKTPLLGKYFFLKIL